jgi:hypothetical protein
VGITGWLKVGDLFSEITGFMIAIQDQVTSTSNYGKHVLKDLNITNDICRKCREELETIQRITDACHALVQGGDTHCHSQVVNTVHQELAIKFALLK